MSPAQPQVVRTVKTQYGDHHADAMRPTHANKESGSTSKVTKQKRPVHAPNNGKLRRRRQSSTPRSLSSIDPLSGDHETESENTLLNKERRELGNRLRRAPRFYFPTDKKLQELRNRTMVAIRQAVKNIMTAKRDIWVPEGRPQLLGAVHSNNTKSSTVLNRIAEPSLEALICKITRAQSHSIQFPVEVGVVLRALLGVGITELVLRADIRALFPDMAWIRATDDISAGSESRWRGAEAPRVLSYE
ncbi:MAG: hypothetical protein Q9208_007520 [Pyrenodesmia sp. 3 TL-2023]